MNRFTLLLSALLTISSWTYAQRSAEQNAFLVHSFNGTLTSAQAYGDGVIWLGNDGTDDVVGYSLDGISFANLENLENTSASGLTSWSGSNLGFYYGNKIADGAGTDLRVNDNGTGRLLWNESGGHDPANPALTNVLRVDQGADGYRYYYIAKGTYVAPTGDEIILWESDGTDFGTLEVEKGLTNANPFDPTERISVKVTNGHNAGKLVGTVHNNKLHIVAAAPGPLGNPSAIYYVDYNASGSTLEFLADIENEVYAWTHLTGMGDYLYAISDDGSMTAIDAEGEKFAVNNGSLLTFSNEQPVMHNNRTFAISTTGGIKKLAIIHSPTQVDIIDLNAENETDNISNLTISGDKLYFWGSKTGDPQLYLFVLRLDQENAQPVSCDDIYAGEGQFVSSMASIGDGSISYSSYSNSSGLGMSYVSEGFESTCYSVVDDDENGGVNTYYWLGEVVQIIAQENTLFYFLQTEDETTGDPKVNVYKLTHYPAEETKPNPLPATTFYRGNYIVNVTDSETGNPIEGATVIIRQRELLLDEISATTNASGQAMYAWKPVAYYHYTASADGYQTLEYDEWATLWVPDELYNPFGTKDVQLVPDGATAIGDVETGSIQITTDRVANRINIKASSNITSLEVYSMTGHKVMHLSDNNINSADIAHLTSGIYITIATDDKGNTKTVKIQKL